MDIVINSSIQSPLVRTLSSTNGKAQNFAFHLKDNIPPVSFGKIELEPDGGSEGGYNRNYKFKIPQVGYWRGFLLKFTAGELGLGTQLIQDIYNSVVSASQYACNYFSLDGALKTSYPKTCMVAGLKRTWDDGSTTAPHTQTTIPWGWVSPFDGNVRSGNFDPWESMWIRLRGGDSYGNTVTIGTYPAPQRMTSKGDARIAPFRHTPRCPILNAFGRNVHNLGNELYDVGDVSGNNRTKAGAGGYCSKTCSPGDPIPGSSMLTYSLTNNLGYYTASSSTILSGSIDTSAAYPTIDPAAPSTSSIGGVTGAHSNVPYNSIIDTYKGCFSDGNGVIVDDALASSGTLANNVPFGCFVDGYQVGFSNGGLTTISTSIGTNTFRNDVPHLSGPISSNYAVPAVKNATQVVAPLITGDFAPASTVAGDIYFQGQVLVGSFFANAVPSDVTQYDAFVNTAGSGKLTVRTNVPYGASLIGGIPQNCRKFETFGADENSDHLFYVSGVPRECSNSDSYSLSGTLTTKTVPVYTGNHTNVPYGCTSATCPTGAPTLLNNVPYNVVPVSLASNLNANHLNVSSSIDFSFVSPPDGVLFHQIPYYDSINSVSTLQQDGAYTQGSKTYASTTPGFNSNTQMRNRYLGQRLASTYDWSSQANLSKHLGAMMVQQITLSTHSRILQTIYPAETLARIYRMDTDSKRKWLSLIRPHITTCPSSIQSGDTQTPGYTGSVNTTGVTWQRSDSYSTYRTWTCYFPCFFSFFEEPSSNLDTRFIENIEVDVLVSPVQYIYDPCDLGIASARLGTTYAMDSSNDDRSCMTTYQGYNTQEFRKRVSVIDQNHLTVSALCYFHNFHDSTNESIRRLNFKPNVPCHILGYNTYQETPVSLSAQQIVQGSTIHINLQCTNLVTEVIFMIRRRQKDVTAHPQLESFPFENTMTTLPIQSVSLTACGQQLYSATGVECLLADQWDFSLGSIHSGKNTTNNSSIYADAHESYYAQSKPTCDGFFGYRIPFSFSQDKTYNSGSVAFQTLNNPILTITIPPLHGWVIQDDNLAVQLGSLFNLSENLNQRECDTQTIFDNDFQIEVYENYFQLNRIDSNTGVISKSLDM